MTSLRKYLVHFNLAKVLVISISMAMVTGQGDSAAYESVVLAQSTTHQPLDERPNPTAGDLDGNSPTSPLTSPFRGITKQLVHTTASPLTSKANIFLGTMSSVPKRGAATTVRPLIVPTLPDFRRRIANAQRSYESKRHHDHHWGPFFEEPLNASATSSGALQVDVHLGTEALLNCRVGMLSDKTVMWVRKTTDKVSLLTVGNDTHSGDSRIGVKFQYPNNWRLHIKPVQRDDAGLYMCQVSTHPPRVFATNVAVLGPAIRVVDEHGYEVLDRFYKLGSAIELTCQVAVSFLSVMPTIVPGSMQRTTKQQLSTPPQQPQPQQPSLKQTKEAKQAKEAKKSSAAGTLPLSTLSRKSAVDDRKNALLSSSVSQLGHFDYLHQQLEWRKDGALLPPDVSFNLSSTSEWRSSQLSIPFAERQHSGLYSCALLNSTTAVVHVQVLNDESPAAIQHNNSHGHYNSPAFRLAIAFVIVNISSTFDIASHRIRAPGFCWFFVGLSLIKMCFCKNNFNFYELR